jgi:hypothetical protein
VSTVTVWDTALSGVTLIAATDADRRQDEVGGVHIDDVLAKRDGVTDTGGVRRRASARTIDCTAGGSSIWQARQTDHRHVRVLRGNVACQKDVAITLQGDVSRVGEYGVERNCHCR